MAAFSGGLTYRQYYVKDALPDKWRDAFQTGIETEKFKGLEPASEEERAVGWCSAQFPLDVDLTTEDYLFGEYIVLSMRIDAVSVPGQLLRIYTEKESRRIKLETKRENLSRYETAEIKERVKMELKRRIPASIKSIDVVWNWREGVVRFFSTNEKVNLEFQELFELTFGLTAIADSCYTAAIYGGLKLTDAEKDALETVEPSAFVDPDTAFAAMTEV